MSRRNMKLVLRRVAPPIAVENRRE